MISPCSVRGSRLHPLMEPKRSNTIVTNNKSNNTIVANEADDDNKNKTKIKDHHHHQAGQPKPMKKRGAMHLIRVALYMLRRKSKTSVHVDLASKVLGSMRSLRLHSNNNDNNNNNNQQQQRPSKDIETHVAPPMIEQTTSSITEEVLTPPVSPSAPKSIASSSSVDSLSQYASATNLQELDASEEEDEDDDNDNGGDEMIDAKAEEFITQFYEQMRIQNFEYVKSHKQMKLKQADMSG
ncbi:hypothetical protein AB3S75_025939 [Citrus x aurantiifolia]